MTHPGTGQDHQPHHGPSSSPVTGDRGERVGWYFYDWANSAFSTTVVTVFLGPYLGAVARRAAGCTAEADVAAGCPGARLHPLGIPVAPGSFFAYTVSLSVLLTVVALPVIGAVADRSAHKRLLLAAFAYTGAGATIGLVFLTGTRYLLGGGPFLFANVASARASWSTTPSCRRSPRPRSATPCRAVAGRWATWAAACCSR